MNNAGIILSIIGYILIANNIINYNGIIVNASIEILGHSLLGSAVSKHVVGLGCKLFCSSPVPPKNL